MKDYYSPNFLNSKKSLICTVCGEEFKPDDDTKYIISGGYTCSWKCFANEVKRRTLERRKEEKEKYKENKNRKK